MNNSTNAPTVALSHHTLTRGDYTISTDPARLDVDVIHGYLSRSYWANTRPREIVELSLRPSLNFGLYYLDPTQESTTATQVGLARVITDYAVFAYLCDVFILEEHRGHGLGKWLIESVVAAPALKHVMRFMLATRDAHSLYSQFGFAPVVPEVWMERTRPK